MRSLLLILLLAVALLAQAADRQLRVVELRYSLAQPVLEVLRPHLPAGAGASAVDNKLLLNLTEQEWASVQNLIGQLDKAPARLLITVQWQQNSSDKQESIDAEVSASNGSVEVDTDIRYQTSRRSDDNLQQVHSLSGQTAFIHTGVDIPELTFHLTTRGRIVTSSRYRESGRGFFVLPLVQGDQVFVRINPREYVPVTGEDGSLHISALETEVRGPLGEWLLLGASRQAGNTTWQTQRNDWSVKVKVDKLP